MKLFINPSLYKVLLAVLLVGIIVGCAQVRHLTYPEDFTYLEKGQVKDHMREMDNSVVRLGRLVEKSSAEIDQQQVIASLSELENITARLSAGHEQTNQMFIRDHIEQFITDVGTAKLFAKTNPPNYIKAREITNSCQDCHKSR